MTEIDTVVIGAGHAGLAVSRLLTAAHVEHVVIERGRIGERWRTERWDSLHLLTPAWMTRLPGWQYRGPDQDAYLAAADFVHLLEDYAASFGAPIVDSTSVTRVAESLTARHRYDVVTSSGTWCAQHVVVATGPHGLPHVPKGLHAPDLEDTALVTSREYRNPRRLPPGGVMVVGASSSGVQIAEELALAGKDVVLSVGRHTRMPRRYRGLDIFSWLETTGRLGRTVDDVSDVARARRETSMQLVGRNGGPHEGVNLDLGTLQRHGVRVVGRLEGLKRATARFRDDLTTSIPAAEKRMHRLLDVIDRHVLETGAEGVVERPVRPHAVPIPSAPVSLDLHAERIGTVILATGYRPYFPWLHLPVVASDGSVEQYRGATAAPGVYIVGQRFQHRRDSSFIDGARHDAAMVVRHLTASRNGTVPPVGQDEESAA